MTDHDIDRASPVLLATAGLGLRRPARSARGTLAPEVTPRRMTMAALPQWMTAEPTAETARTDEPGRMTMSRVVPRVRTTIGRQR